MCAFLWFVKSEETNTNTWNQIEFGLFAEIFYFLHG